MEIMFKLRLDEQNEILERSAFQKEINMDTFIHLLMNACNM